MTMTGSVDGTGSSGPPRTTSNATSDTTSSTTAHSFAEAQTPGEVVASQVTAWGRLIAEPTAAERLVQAPGEQPQPAFYQAPTSPPLPGSNVPYNGTHVGMTEAAGTANAFHPNFTGWAADMNAQVDHSEYANDAAHAYNFSMQATLERAGTLGACVDAAATRYLAATDATARQAAARELSTAFGQYQHMVQDNRAHGGTDRAQHYGAHVDENPQSMAAARRDASATFAELHAYLQSRGIEPRTVDPGPRPSYNYPPLSALGDSMFAPHWDGVDRMWNRDVMFDAMRDRFDRATPMGHHPASL
jgi:hypothetical protein